MDMLDDAGCVKECVRLVVEGTAPVSRPKKTLLLKECVLDWWWRGWLPSAGQRRPGTTLYADTRLQKVDPGTYTTE